MDLDKHLTLYEPSDNFGSIINGLRLCVESALANEPKKQRQTSGLLFVCAHACMFVYVMGIQFLYECKAVVEAMFVQL